MTENQKLGSEDGVMVQTRTQYTSIGILSSLLAAPAFFYSLELAAILLLGGLSFLHRSYQLDKLNTVYQTIKSDMQKKGDENF